MGDVEFDVFDELDVEYRYRSIESGKIFTRCVTVGQDSVVILKREANVE